MHINTCLSVCDIRLSRDICGKTPFRYSAYLFNGEKCDYLFAAIAELLDNAVDEV